MSNYSIPSHEENVFDIRELAVKLWRKKLWLLLGVILGAAYGFNTVRNFQPQYTAYMVVQSSSDGDASGLSRQLSGLKNLAGLVGVPSGGRNSSPVFDRFEILVGTITFAEQLEEKQGLQKKLYSGSWDEVNQNWRQPNGYIFAWKQKLYKYLKMRTWRQPDIEMMAQYLKSAVKFDPIETTQFVKISFKHKDPEFALFVLGAIFKEADVFLRKEEKKQAERKSEYLWARLSEVRRPEARNALIALLESVEKSTMMLSGGLPYLARIIEPPRVASNTLYTAGVRSIAISASGGLFVMMLLLSIYIIFKRESN
jgi:uncharacterized protein involved in exopolysaccharide biosynthesis